MQESIAEGLKDNRRLATFQIEECAEFLEYLKSRYNSELDSWLTICPQDSWKYPFILREIEIRRLENKIQALEALLW